MSVGVVEEPFVDGALPTIVNGYVTPFVGSVNEPAQCSTVFASASGVTPPCWVKPAVSPAVSRVGSVVDDPPPPASAVAAIVAAIVVNTAKASRSLRFIKSFPFPDEVSPEDPLSHGQNPI